MLMTFTRRIRSSFFSVLFLSVAACQSAPTSVNTPIEPIGASEVAAADAANAIAPYTLGNGDKIRITVFGEPDLSGEYVIDGAGQISMPLIGEIQTHGMTIRQLQRHLEEEYRKGYLNSPKISAEVINYRPYYIMGEVNNPGEYPYTAGLTINNAVATAGGFTYRANKKTVFVRGAKEQAERDVALTPTTQVNAGDTIRIGERLF